MSSMDRLTATWKRNLGRFHTLLQQRWVLPYCTSRLRTLVRPTTESPLRKHLLFCFCDHYEPEWHSPGHAQAEARVAFWQHRYGPALSTYRDADGRPPQHSFFFPGEEYRPSYLARLTDLVAQGYGEVELHLHHDRDTSQVLEAKINQYLEILGSHGHFSRRSGRGSRYAYGFIHGNWALANAHGTGRHCGVSDELEILFRTGCYADYTFPSAPHTTQPRLHNQIYWPTGDLRRARCYEQGEQARVGRRFDDRLLLVQGPLSIDPRGLGKLPRIESAAVTATDPATPSRVRSWVHRGIGILGRPEWVFVKIHTHGAPEKQAASILGRPGQEMHETLRREFNDGQRWTLHYVSAREMYNIACAAMDGHGGNPHLYRDYLLPPPPASSNQRENRWTSTHQSTMA